MKTYNKNIKLKLKDFFEKSFKYKINSILVLLGIKFLIYKILRLFLSFFINSKIPFIRRIIFDINSKKKYI